MISRREFLTISLLAGPALLSVQAAATDRDLRLQQSIANLERKYGGRLGVAILNTGKKNIITYRGDERFPMCSTFKCLAAALVLARVDSKKEHLTRRVVYDKKDLVHYSPITQKHVGPDGLTVSEICKAAVTLSDNTAGNLMLDSFGGPAGLTTYLRSLGDKVTRLDRREPDLNEAIPGDPRDTTSPIAMLQTLHKLVLGTALSHASREQLIAWLVATKTGDKRLRAGVPSGWRVGDKTGTGAHNATNDVAILWPLHHAPILVTTYYVGSPASEDARNAVLAEVGRLASTI